MNMNTKKKEYTKPGVKLVEWNFSEAVCDTVTRNSYANCFNVTNKSSFELSEHRQNSSGWNRVGSDRTGGN